MLLAQTVEGASTAYPLQGSEQPQSHQNGWVNRILTRLPFNRPDGSIQRRQVQALDEIPHQSSRMIAGQGTLQVEGAQDNLLPLNPFQTRLPFHWCLACFFSRRKWEQRIIHFVPPRLFSRRAGLTLQGYFYSPNLRRGVQFIHKLSA